MPDPLVLPFCRVGMAMEWAKNGPTGQHGVVRMAGAGWNDIGTPERSSLNDLRFTA